MVLDNVVENLLFAFEVHVERAAAHVDGFGDVAHGGLVYACLREQGFGNLDDFALRLAQFRFHVSDG